MAEPVNRTVPTLADAQAFILEAAERGYGAVYLTPEMYRQVREAAMPPGGRPVGLVSIRVYPEALMPAGRAIAYPRGWASEWVAG